MEKPNKENKKKIEDSIRELEAITQQLEKGEIELDQAFKLFEKGMEIHEEIKKKITEYEKKIKILTNKFKDGKPLFSNYDSDE